jgi:hypothetical protein
MAGHYSKNRGRLGTEEALRNRLIGLPRLEQNLPPF